MDFIQKDELGLERTYYVVAQLEYRDKAYVIYTDLLNDTNRDFRLFVGQTNNGKVIRIEKNKESEIIDYFTKIETNYKELMKEVF